jgi:hypothetical protein
MRTPIPAVVMILLLAGCSATGDLRAELVTPVDIDLEWTADPAAADAGQVLEFATEPAGPWTILGFLPADQERYQHPDLIPDTAFYYRVRPLLGAASEPVRVHLAAAGFDEPVADADLSWADPRTVDNPPAALTATVKGRDAVLFTWTDDTVGEDGQLLEVKPDGAPQWTVAMALDPDVNSAGLMTLDTERRASFRVRAFTFGESSGVAHRTTGH